MAIVAKKTVMSLYTDSDDLYCHQVRIVLAEKGVNVEFIECKQGCPSKEILDMNPYGTLPVLIDRELVIFEARIIMEYLDERFPHPPLLPVYPVARAESRKLLFRIENEWYPLVKKIRAGEDIDASRNILLNSFIELDQMFAAKPYFLSDDFSLMDCTIAPILWRLPQLGITIPDSSKGLLKYMTKVFNKESFKNSLTEQELAIRAA